MTEVVRAFEMRYAISDDPVASHSVAMCETAATETALSHAIAVAGVLALTACDLLSNPGLVENARADFDKRVGYTGRD